MPAVPRTLVLLAELTVLFVGMPLAFRFKRVFLPPLPVLWVFALYCLYQLYRDPSFDREMLWNPRPLAAATKSIVACFLLAAVTIATALWQVRPDLLFSFVKRAPVWWAVVMVLYPVLSVYPQGIVFRAYFMHRFADLFIAPSVLVFASAIAFSFMHIIFRNWIAVGLTLAGGLLFAWRYMQTGSLLASSFEHALYGCWMFTVGLGEFFYKGAR